MTKDLNRLTWRTGGLVTATVLAIFGTGLGAGRLLEIYDQDIGFKREAAQIANVLGVKSGMTIADVRAGRGHWTVDLAKRVGDKGLVYATPGPVSPVHILFETVAESGVNNVSVITETPGESVRLPVGCCDAILLRHVYRDFEDRAGFAGRLYRYVRPGGRLVIIDRIDQTAPGAPTRRVSPRDATDEITAAGFKLETMNSDWGPNAYCLVFRRPDGEPTSRAVVPDPWQIIQK